MKFIAGVLMIFAAINANGQQLKEEFALMNAHLNSRENYKVSVNYILAENAKVEEKGNVSVLVTKQGMYYDMGTANVIINAKNTLLIEHEKGTIIYSNNTDLTRKKTFSVSDYILQGIDSLVANADTVMMESVTEGRIYYIRNSKAYFNLVEVEFRGKLLHKVIYHYNDNHVDQKGLKTECTVSFTENITVEPGIIETRNYITTNSNGELVPSEQYIGYLVVFNESLDDLLKN